MGILLSIVALLIAFAGGLGIVLLLRSHDSHLDGPGVAGTAIILGIGLVTVSTFCLGVLFQGAMLRIAVACLCLALAALGWKKYQWVLPKFPVTDLTPFAVPAIVLCFLTWFSLYRSELDWDGLFNWESKARVAFLNNGAIPLSYYTSGYDFFHRSYPPLTPLFEVWIYGFLGRMDQSVIKLVGPYLFLAIALLMVSFANREKRNGWRRILVVLPFLLVPILLMGGGSASSGYSDFPVAAIYLCTMVHGLEYWKSRSLESARLAGLSAMLLPFTKADGLVPLLCFAVAMAPLIWRNRNWKIGAWMLAPGLAMAIAWKSLMAILGVPHESDFLGFTPAILFAHLDRARPIIVWTLEELTVWSRWSLLWPAAIAGFVALTLRKPKMEWWPWAAGALLPLVLFPCVYFFSAWDPVQVHVTSSLPRLFIQVAPVAALMAGAAFAELMEVVAIAEAAEAEMLEPLFREAAEILQPMGVSVLQVRQAYELRMSERLLEQAAEVLRPAGITVDHLRRVSEKATVDARPVIEEPQKPPVKDGVRRKSATSGA